MAVQMRAHAEVNVAHGETGKFGDTHSGLRGEHQQGVITATVPAELVRRREQRLRSRKVTIVIVVGLVWIASTRPIRFACSGA